jgi:hypothetical protein
MTPETFLATIIDPGLDALANLGGPAPSHDARRMCLTIAMQESGRDLNARYQNSPSTSPGPARGWWQFEQGGGVNGVLNHSGSKTQARKLCDHCAVQAQDGAVWRALEGHDDLACGFARLLLWTDPKALPTNAADGWDYYLRNWRPGKPHRENWDGNWMAAETAVAAAEAA